LHQLIQRVILVIEVGKMKQNRTTLLSLLFVLCAPSTSTFFPRSNFEKKFQANEPAGAIAYSLNDEKFLKELVSLKEAKDMEYRTIENYNQEVNEVLCENHPSPSTCFSTVCEYTAGNIWFLPRAGVKFREKMAIKQVSTENHQATVECEADFFDGKKWINCAKTTCKINSRTIPLDKKECVDVIFQHHHQKLSDGFCDNPFELQLDVKTNLMIRLPLIAGRVSKMINSTFQDAVASFVRNHHGIPPNAFKVV